MMASGASVDLLTRDARVDHCDQRLAREDIDERQRTQAPAVKKRIRDEVVHRQDVGGHLAMSQDGKRILCFPLCRSCEVILGSLTTDGPIR